MAKNNQTRLRDSKGRFMKKEKKYESNCNCQDPILYIILNEDVEMSVGERMAVVSHLTSRFAMYDFLYELNQKMEVLQENWLNSFGGYGNTVILVANNKTIYDNCMASYDNVYFDKYVEDTKRVAHHNWKLNNPKHVGLAFFGIKSEMPKWVRNLELI